MGKREIEFIKKLRSFKKDISTWYNIEKLILFGSRATGNYGKYSDFDIIMVSDKFKGVNRLDRPYKLYLKWNLDYPVDFLCYTPEEFNKLKKQITIVREAVEEGIEI